MSEFRHQCVRDLAWAIASPPLLSQVVSKAAQHCAWPPSQWYQQLYDESLPWLKKLDSDPSALEALIGKQRDRRLGKYFETLWFYWLKFSPRYEIVENNVQVIIDGETLGEIDFIVFDKITRQTIHWELAVKFYLGHGDTREMKNWHGPNLRDRLDIKVDHLLHKQSMISKDRRVKQWLHRHKMKIDQCAVILKGRLYYPWQTIASLTQSQSLKAVTPLRCPDELAFGCWFRLSQFDEVFDEAARFVPLINAGWLEKIPTIDVREKYSKEGIYKTVSKNIVRYPLHLLLCSPLHSLDRVFMVDESWPHKGA